MIVGNTITQSFRQVVKKYPHKRALMFKEKGVYHSIDFNEFWKRVREVATSLQELGIKKGDRVAILSNNRPEWAIADLATMMIGAIVVPIHMNLSAKIINYILNHCEAKLIVVSNEEQLNKISQEELNFLGNFIFLGEVSDEMKDNWKSIISWKEFVAKGIKKVDQNLEDQTNENDVCTIIYTSGTTGLPKGVELTHKNFVSDIHMTLDAISFYPSDTFLSFLPLSHVLERMGGYYLPIFCGATIAYAESVKELSNNLKEVKPTVIVSVPRIFEKFNDAIHDKVKGGSVITKKLFYFALHCKKGTLCHWIFDKLVFGKVRKQFGGRLRVSISGGASLDEKIGKFFSKLGITILEGYGLTETAPVLAVNRFGKIKFGTVGLPLQGVELKIMSDKEIVAKGPNIMKGYYKNPQATEEVIDAEGWFHTGDYGFIDSDGSLVVIGRKKEMIITSGGKNIWPEHIEQELNYESLISQSIIVGHKRKYVSALIVPDRKELSVYLRENELPDTRMKELVCHQDIIKIYNECIDRVNAGLSEYERIREFILIPREFSQELDELTPTLKIRRHAIEHHFKEEIDLMYK